MKYAGRWEWFASKESMDRLVSLQYVISYLLTRFLRDYTQSLLFSSAGAKCDVTCMMRDGSRNELNQVSSPCWRNGRSLLVGMVPSQAESRARPHPYSLQISKVSLTGLLLSDFLNAKLSVSKLITNMWSKPVPRSQKHAVGQVIPIALPKESI